MYTTYKQATMIIIKCALVRQSKYSLESVLPAAIALTDDGAYTELASSSKSSWLLCRPVIYYKYTFEKIILTKP